MNPPAKRSRAAPTRQDVAPGKERNWQGGTLLCPPQWPCLQSYDSRTHAPASSLVCPHRSPHRKRHGRSHGLARVLAHGLAHGYAIRRHGLGHGLAHGHTKGRHGLAHGHTEGRHGLGHGHIEWRTSRHHCTLGSSRNVLCRRWGWQRATNNFLPRWERVQGAGEQAQRARLGGWVTCREWLLSLLMIATRLNPFGSAFIAEQLKLYRFIFVLDRSDVKCLAGYLCSSGLRCW